MLRIHLLTATAAVALLAAPAALAQTAPTPPLPTPVPVTSATPATPPTAAPDTPAPSDTPAEPADEAAPAAPAPTAQVTAAPAAQAATPAAAGNVIDVLTAQGNFTTLLTALNQAQLTDILKSRGAVTIFAPTDEAFAALPEAERTRLMDPANAQDLRNLLLYHVIVADVSSSQITGTKGGVQTANRTRVLLDGMGEGLRIDGATVTRADIDASNGAVFAIDKVLNPARSMAPPEAPAPTAAADGATATTQPAAPGTTAPNGQPAATTTTVASPPVHNPTDGQVDARPDPAPAAAAAAAAPAAPAAPAATSAPAAPTATTRPAAPGATAPNGQQAGTTTTIAAPPVPNPTDGQVDRPGTPRN
jgi:uncharacterized surface protein with fasciclin (FAS1) repeats